MTLSLNLIHVKPRFTKVFLNKSLWIFFVIFWLGLIGEAFLEETASQLTYHGLCELNLHLQDDQLGVFFRNNHFSTFHKHKV